VVFATKVKKEMNEQEIINRHFDNEPATRSAMDHLNGSIVAAIREAYQKGRESREDEILQWIAS